MTFAGISPRQTRDSRSKALTILSGAEVSVGGGRGLTFLVPPGLGNKGRWKNLRSLDFQTWLLWNVTFFFLNDQVPRKD